jgi:lysyl-tRNA synthetase class 2
MDECEALIGGVASALGRGGRLLFQGHEIDLGGKWERITVAEAFRRYTRHGMGEALESGLFDELMVEEIEPRLGISTPVFIHDYPASRGALARLKPDQPEIAERFELYIGGLELANAFTELTDQAEQRSRFEAERDHRLSLGRGNYPMPEPFLNELPAMPPSAGIALGLDRLVMVLIDAPTIDGVVAFTPEDL